MAITPAALDEVVAGLDHVLELIEAARRDPPGVPSVHTRLDACQRRAAVLVHLVVDELAQAAP